MSDYNFEEQIDKEISLLTDEQKNKLLQKENEEIKNNFIFNAILDVCVGILIFILEQYRMMIFVGLILLLNFFIYYAKNQTADKAKIRRQYNLSLKKNKKH